MTSPEGTHGSATGASTVARVVVVGLGPADPSLLTTETAHLLADADHSYLRTACHPAAAALPRVPTFDHLYDQAHTLDAVYLAIVDALRRAALEHGRVVYAVPGSPMVAERTVELLRDSAADAPGELVVEVHPAMSFLDLAWARLGIDPLAAGVRLIDGQRFAIEAAGERGPLLVAQCDSGDVLSDIKLAIGEAIDFAQSPPAHDLRITVMQRLGLPDERVFEVNWPDIDRRSVVDPDHLTSLWIPHLDAPTAGEVQRLVDLVATLRRRCPWDQEQTHKSLRRHLLEEAYEVIDAINGLDDVHSGGFEHLEEELGDLLFQVVFHATLAAEEGQFTMADVARGIHDKLYSRHPHVFGDVPEGLAPGHTAGEVAANWEQIKKAEKQRSSVFEGIPEALPALLFALKIQKKAASLGEMAEDLPSPGSWDHVVTTARRAPTVESIGDLLFVAVNMARHAHIDPEMALRDAASRYRALVRQLEH